MRRKRDLKKVTKKNISDQTKQNIPDIWPYQSHGKGDRCLDLRMAPHQNLYWVNLIRDHWHYFRTTKTVVMLTPSNWNVIKKYHYSAMSTMWDLCCLGRRKWSTMWGVARVASRTEKRQMVKRGVGGLGGEGEKKWYEVTYCIMSSIHQRGTKNNE